MVRHESFKRLMGTASSAKPERRKAGFTSCYRPDFESLEGEISVSPLFRGEK
jgi:hypothetical protein